MQPDAEFVDIDFLGYAGIVGTGVLRTASGVWLVDPGPSSGLDGLGQGLRSLGLSMADVRGLLLTHIHLDHAGASGTIVRDWPDVQVYVHQHGLRHLLDPSRLLESAARLYGSEMERLWGAVLPVPESQVHALSGGERLDLGGRWVEVAYTPGHATHHVSYLDAQTKSAFVGDTGGVCLPGARQVVVPPTPPPDISLELWRDSIRRIGEWQPRRLYVTHFGAIDDPAAHLLRLEKQLEAFANLVLATLGEQASDQERVERFVERAVGAVRKSMSDEDIRRYQLAMQFDHCWFGLARYWRRKNS
jgi:glyoxylase-like metal-dependent hydrolase (beta-lactamase superfamily II)